MSKINLQVLFLTYGDKYDGSLDILNIYLKQIKEYCNVKLIVIDNKHIDGKTYEGKADIILGGNNEEFEFSGFNTGISYLKEDKTDYDVCLFINDSFLINDYWLNRNLLSMKTIQGCLDNNALVGKCDRMDWRDEFKDLRYEIEGQDVRMWIRTNLFYMTKDIVDNLETMVTYTNKDLNKFISKEYNGRCFLHNADISVSLQSQMINYITENWHSKIKICKETWQIWRFKVLAMILEKFLYVKVKKLGYNIYDYSEFQYGGE